MLYKSKGASVQSRPKKIGNTFIGSQTDLSQYGYYTVANAKPADAPEGQRYVDSGNGTYDEQSMTYTADWVLEAIPPEPVPDYGTKITHFAMRKRFTFEERVAIEGASDTDKSVKTLLKDMDSAKFIDLSLTDLIQGIYMLEEKGLINTGRASEIINTPVQADEV